MIQTVERWVAECDGCGLELPVRRSKSEMLALALRKGWDVDGSDCCRCHGCAKAVDA